VANIVMVEKEITSKVTKKLPTVVVPVDTICIRLIKKKVIKTNKNNAYRISKT
jgi:hypothetical protein